MTDGAQAPVQPGPMDEYEESIPNEVLGQVAEETPRPRRVPRCGLLGEGRNPSRRT